MMCDVFQKDWSWKFHYLSVILIQEEASIYEGDYGYRITNECKQH